MGSSGSLLPVGDPPQLIPEEKAENGVRSQAEVSGAEALIQGQDAFLPRDPHDAVEEAAVMLALQRGGKRAGPVDGVTFPTPNTSSPNGFLRGDSLTVPLSSTGWL